MLILLHAGRTTTDNAVHDRTTTSFVRANLWVDFYPSKRLLKLDRFWCACDDKLSWRRRRDVDEDITTCRIWIVISRSSQALRDYNIFCIPRRCNNGFVCVCVCVCVCNDRQQSCSKTNFWKDKKENWNRTLTNACPKCGNSKLLTKK